MTIKPHTPVVVTWEDARCDAGAQHESPAGVLRAYKPTIRRSHGLWCGWAVRDGREAAVIATDDDRSDDEPDAVGGPSYIPRGMVIEVQPLRLAVPTKKRRKRA